MKKVLLLIGSAVVFVYDTFLTAMCRVLGQSPPDRRTVLVYHNVRADEQAAFQRQANTLRARCQPCDPAAFFLPGAAGHRVLVTFDDAYEDIFQYAVPRLQEKRIPCLVFVPVSNVGEPPRWTRRTTADVCGPSVATWQTLASAPAGVTFGAHGCRHLYLPAADEREARDEILNSKIMLEKALGKPVQWFAFPYGAYEPAHVELCRRAGYSAAFGAIPGALHQATFVIPRTSVNPGDSPLEFFLKIKGAYRWQGSLSRFKKNIFRSGSLRPRPELKPAN